jgi:hypothetical protein
MTHDFATTHIALYTFGLLKAPFGAEEMSGLSAAAPSVYGEAETAEGFIGHAAAARPDLGGVVPGQDYGPWGVFVAPRFYQGSTRRGEVAMIATLSLWQDVDAARQYVYNGLHRDALRRRTDWFTRHEFPGYVLWWVSADRVPTWAEGARKLEALTDDGPTPSAFNFVTRFDSSGRPLGNRVGKIEASAS